jgi:hypothetical protein
MAPHLGSSYRGVVLVGWMERDYAVRFLTEECVFDPPLSETAAESLWREYRTRASTLPMRDGRPPARLPLTTAEREHVERFLQFLAATGAPPMEVIKIDPLQLVAAQSHIATDLAENYRLRGNTEAEWMEVTLPTSSINPDVNVRFTRRNLDTEIEINLPHGEFIFGVNPQGGFGPREFLGCVTVINTGNRMLLGKGYHRLYARMLSTLATPYNRSALVALDPNTILPPAREGVGAAGSRQAPSFDVFGSRPALFSDFFTDGLFLKVNLRKKRYQLRVLARWVALDDGI